MAEYVWIGREYVWICLNMSEFSIIDRVLNISLTIHSARSLYKLMSTYWEMAYSEPGQRSKMEHFGKIIVVLTIFEKKLRLKSLRDFWICIGFQVSEFCILVNFRRCDRVLNTHRDATMEGFWIFQDSKYVRFLHMQALHKVLNMPEHSWIMPYGRVFWICMVSVSQGFK